MVQEEEIIELIRNNDYTKLENILKLNPDIINTLNDNNNRKSMINLPLHYALFKGNFNIISLILKYLTNFDTRDSTGYPPLYYAMKTRNLDIVKLFINSDADLNIRWKGYPLFWEIMRPYGGEEKICKKILKLFIKKEVNLNAVNDEGNTCLIDVIINGAADKNIIPLLLKTNIDIDIKNNEGHDALYIAIECRYVNIVSQIYEHKLKKQQEYYEQKLKDQL